MKVNLFDHTSFTAFGDIFHKVLKNMDKDDFDFDKAYQEAIDEVREKYEVDFTVKEKFYLDKLKPDLLFIINTINEFKKYTGLNKELHEEEIIIPLMDNPNVSFKGYVDKIMYGDYDNKTLISVIDYKTGKVDINMDLIKYGLSMQLPVYIYLIKKSNLFINPYIVGFYLEHILDNEIKRDSKKSYEELKKENLKLVGYSIDNIDYLSIFDSTYEDSKMIRNMKLTKSGTLNKDGHPISEEKINKIIETVDKNIKTAINDIISGNFPINPKIIKDKNKSCNYCKFKEICYLSDQNKIYIDTEEGDEDVDA
jgi:ATP-dependent helicase/nuclease subunit B